MRSSPITAEELRSTLQSCRDSAPGPDGIPYSIIGLLWPVFGAILTNAWNYSLTTSKLPTSHKQSYLRLIPKAGKDLRRLTNWRPITLSNCDHKLITKTYSKRLCEKLADKIDERQTAYLKGRLINDNIRSMISTINITQEEVTDGLLVALDAKKAFDSVSHQYIERCLESFGCKSFVPIFKILYSELRTDIIINGKVVRGFLVKRAGKQGDALSCIIFIMCMEPLLRNIELNPLIAPITSRILDRTLPKTYAYADDINATIQESQISLQSLFLEYERLSRKSGLELNADKTEIMRLGGHNERTLRVTYLNKTFVIETIPKIKINGILFQRDTKAMEQENVDAACARIDQQFNRWAKRSLTTLGKVLIVKTFGISQIIYIMQSLVISPVSFKKLNALLYKFIWNRHYRAAKAPERIERAIVNKPLKLGGLGMLDIEALDASLKLRALGRLLSTKHPFLGMIKERIDLKEFFNPCTNLNIEGVSAKGIEFLKGDRNKLWGKEAVENNVLLNKAIRDTSIKQVVSSNGLRSIGFFTIWRRGARKIKDLTANDLFELRRHISAEKLNGIERARVLGLGALTEDEHKMYLVTNQFKPLIKCTSSELRVERSTIEPIVSYKIGMNLTRTEALSWGLKLTKVSSTAHKNIILRVAHGDIYTKAKLLRFGLAPDSTCPRCNEVETLRHKFIECDYVKRIWDVAFKYTKEFTLSDPTREERTKAVLGAYLNSNSPILTLNCEILHRINGLRQENYLIHPRILVKAAARAVLKKEKHGKCKDVLKSICDRMMLS